MEILIKVLLIILVAAWLAIVFLLCKSVFYPEKKSASETNLCGGAGGFGTPVNVIRYSFPADGEELKKEGKMLNADELREAIKKLVMENEGRAVIIIQKPKNQASLSWVYMNHGQALDTIKMGTKMMKEQIEAHPESAETIGEPNDYR